MDDDSKTFLMCGLTPIAEFYDRYQQASDLAIDKAKLHWYEVLNRYQQLQTVLGTAYRVVHLGRRPHLGRDLLLPDRVARAACARHGVRGRATRHRRDDQRHRRLRQPERQPIRPAVPGRPAPPTGAQGLGRHRLAHRPEDQGVRPPRDYRIDYVGHSDTEIHVDWT
jgi:predicted nucleic acid-binding protein